MPPSALALLLTAAVLHAAWNLLVRQAAERFVLLWWALVMGSAAALPLLAGGAPLPARIWPYAVASGLLNAAYFAALVGAYARGDFSLVYPVARGVAPAWIAVGSVLFLGERPRPLGMLGVGLVIAGLVVTTAIAAPWRRIAWRGRARAGGADMRGAALRVTPAGTGLALLVSVFVASYTLVDGAAVRRVPPAAYLALVFALSAVSLVPVMLARYGVTALLRGLAGDWRRAALVAGLSLAAYFLVLRAYAIAPVAYAGAVRESSVVIAALAGWLLLGEPFGVRRTAGALLLLAGVLALAFARG